MVTLLQHEEDADFPLAAMVTSPMLIEAAVSTCLEKYPSTSTITVGDMPLQTCDWKKLANQAGLAPLMNRYASLSRPKVRFFDLRRERFDLHSRFRKKSPKQMDGDPNGYAEVIPDERSFLEPVSKGTRRFHVSDYDPRKTTSSHNQG